MVNKVDVLKKLLIYCKRDSNGCLIFHGALVKGHGRIRIGEKHYQAHRLMLYLMGEIELDSTSMALHKNYICKSRACCEPDHLYVGTAQDNTNDMLETGYNAWLVAAENRKNRTHCKHGHEYTKSNTLKDWRGNRRCRECHRLQNTRSKQERG
jgi:hypothetical protein